MPEHKGPWTLSQAKRSRILRCVGYIQEQANSLVPQFTESAEQQRTLLSIERQVDLVHRLLSIPALLKSERQMMLAAERRAAMDGDNAET